MAKTLGGFITNNALSDEFPGHTESVEHFGYGQETTTESNEQYMAEENDASARVQVDKSNILLLGPTGCGKTYILE